MADYGTKPALLPIEAKRGFDTVIPFSIQDAMGQNYADFADWVFTFAASTSQGGAPFFVMTTAADTPSGSYIKQTEDTGGDVLPGMFEFCLMSEDQGGFSQSSGPSPDRFYYELSATGPHFGKWPLCVGQITIGKSL